MSQPDPKAFRNALGQFATGVTVVTALDGQGNKIGMTANSFSSVSLDPMLVLWSIARTATCFDSFMAADHFIVHVLNNRQQAISNQFASKCIDRFEGISHQSGLGGVPLLNDFSAAFQCQTEHQYEGGDHVIIVGRVMEFDTRDHAPLIFHSGRYAGLEQAVLV